MPKKYRTSVHLGYRPNGKRWVVPIEADTKKELELKKAALLIEREKKQEGKEKQTFGFFLDEFLESRKGQVSERYYRSALCSYAKHLEPLRDIPIKKVNVKQIEQLLEDLAAYNPNTGQPTSYNVVKEVRRMAKNTFLEAQKQDVEVSNKAELASLPKCKPAVHREPIDNEQQQWIRETPHICQTAAMIMLYAGLRRSEVTALTADKVDLERKTIRVCSKCVWDTSSRPRFEDTTKTPAGDRLITIPDILVEYLKSIDLKEYRYFATHSNELVNEDWWDAKKGKWANYLTTLDPQLQ